MHVRGENPLDLLQFLFYAITDLKRVRSGLLADHQDNAVPFLGSSIASDLMVRIGHLRDVLQIDGRARSGRHPHDGVFDLGEMLVFPHGTQEKFFISLRDMARGHVQVPKAKRADHLIQGKRAGFQFGRVHPHLDFALQSAHQPQRGHALLTLDTSLHHVL